MKQTVFLCAAILLIAAGANAQAVSGYSYPLPQWPPRRLLRLPRTRTRRCMRRNNAPAADANAAALRCGRNARSRSKSTDQEPQVQGVFKTYNWQATAGYTFFRFYVAAGR